MQPTVCNKKAITEQFAVDYELSCKFHQLGLVLRGFLVGTFPASKSCLFISKHLRFVGFYIYYACLEFLKEVLVELYALRFLSPESYFTGR